MRTLTRSKTTNSKNAMYQVGSAVMVALAVAGAIWMYPELKRYMNVRRM